MAILLESCSGRSSFFTTDILDKKLQPQNLKTQITARWISHLQKALVMVSAPWIIEWFGLEGLQRASGPTSPAMDMDTFHSIMLIQAPSNLASNISRDGASTVSLGEPVRMF